MFILASCGIDLPLRSRARDDSLATIAGVVGELIDALTKLIAALALECTPSNDEN
jgi:hypothetical protein